MKKKRRRTIFESEHGKLIAISAKDIAGFDPSELEDWPLYEEPKKSIEDNLLDPNIGQDVIDLERIFQLNRILELLIQAFPVPGAKKDRLAVAARLRRAKSALFGTKLGKGRPSAMDPNLLNQIAVNYIHAYVNGGPEKSRDEVITRVIQPSLRQGKKDHKKIERSIKPYRKAFEDNKEWLLLRNSKFFPLAKELTVRGDGVVEFLLDLSQTFRKKK